MILTSFIGTTEPCSAVPQRQFKVNELSAASPALALIVLLSSINFTGYVSKAATSVALAVGTLKSDAAGVNPLAAAAASNVFTPLFVIVKPTLFNANAVFGLSVPKKVASYVP